MAKYTKTPIGNMNGFVISVLSNILYVLGLGYIGGSVAAIVNLKPSEIDLLFPTELDRLPYRNPNNEIVDIEHVSLAEYVFPMETLGFPYTKRIDNPDLPGKFVNWMLNTLVHLMILIRSVFKHGAEFGKIVTNTNIIGDLFTFYIYPNLFIWILSIPLYIPLIGMFISFIKSFDIPQSGWMFTFAPITAPLYSISNKSSLRPMDIIQMFAAIVAGFFIPFIFIPWWILISIFMWLYCIVVIVVSPILYKDGPYKVLQQVYAHRRSLICIFMMSTIYSSNLYLTPPAVTGLTIGALIIAGKMAYNLYYGKAE